MSLFARIKECLETECASFHMDEPADRLKAAIALEKLISAEGRQALIETIRIQSLEIKRLQDELAASAK